MKAMEAFDKMIAELTSMQQDQIHNVVKKYGPIISEALALQEQIEMTAEPSRARSRYEK